MKYTFTILFACLSMIALGQVEQWMEQAETGKGKNKVDLYNQIAEYYTFDSEPFLAKIYAQKAIEIAEDLAYYDGLAVGYFYLAEEYEQALDYCFETLNYEVREYALVRRLKGCVYPMLKEKDQALTQKTIAQLEAWQKTVDQSKYKMIYEGTEELLTLMRTNR